MQCSATAGRNLPSSIRAAGTVKCSTACCLQTVDAAGVEQRRNWYTVFMFALTTGLLFADQNLLAPNVRIFVAFA
jgi:hypothetical protein